MEIELLRDMVVVFGLSAGVLLILHNIKLPAIMGFLLTGILIGPQGLGMIRAEDQVAVLAEIGVILLLFTVGIEVSLKDLMKLKMYVLLGGFLQVSLTILSVFSIMIALGQPKGVSMILGFLISLSSTAIVLRIIQKKEEFDSLYGRTTLGILIFQDIAVVPMMLLIPLLPGATNMAADTLPVVLAKGAGIIMFVLICSKWLVPQILYHIAKTGDRELFLLSIVAICFAVAWITSTAGLSLGLGAFLAGLIISESPYSHQAFGNVLPLRDAFTSFFFVSIGMLLDIGFLLDNPAAVVLVTLGVMAIKTAIAGFVVALLGLPMRIIVLVSLALSQIGEFSFILSKVGFESGIIPLDIYQLFLDVTVLTMAATSLIMALSPRVAEELLRLPFPDSIKATSNATATTKELALKDHLIIVGYGINGRNVARSAKAEDIRYIIVEADPEIVKLESKNDTPIYYGDATQENMLIHAGIKTAKVMVIAISDPSATRRVTELARRLNPSLLIIARTRYLQEMKPLHDLGANEVIPEEYETSVEIFARVLDWYQVPRHKIEGFVAQVRADGYEMFRELSQEPYCSASIDLIAEDISTLRVCKGAPADGKSLSEIRLENYGITPLAIHRELQTIANPEKELKLRADDVLVLMGPEEKIHSIERFFIN